MRNPEYTDEELDSKIEELKAAIEKLAKEFGVWYDCDFRTHLEYFDDEPPDEPCVLVVVGGGVIDHKNGYHGYDFVNAFDELLDGMGYYSDQGRGTLSIYIRDNEELADAFRELHAWRWICHLVEPDYADIYAEIYEHFEKNPGRLHDLAPRQLEVLIDGVMKNLGYRTDLGSGQNDGGVDLRLYSNDAIGEQLTLVQVKRYDPRYPIELQAVQALKAVVDDQNANRGLFITTSRYLPSVRQFASRYPHSLKLADATDLVEWLATAKIRISNQFAENAYAHLFESAIFPDLSECKIYHANTGFDMIWNQFALVLYECRSAAVLVRLQTKIVSGDQHSGEEVPVLLPLDTRYLGRSPVFRARRKDNGCLRGNLEWFYPWDGKPQHFDHWD